MCKLGSVFIEINHVVTFSSERYDLSCVRVVSVGKACESEVRDSLRRSVGVCVHSTDWGRCARAVTR